MKTPLKSVLATLVALFLSISLSGCSDEDSKATSQGGGADLFASKGFTIKIPKFNQEEEITLDLFGKSIATDPEVEAFYRETWSSLGRNPRKDENDYGKNLVTMHVTVTGGNTIVIPDSIAKKLHEFKLRIRGREYALWADGMGDSYYILPLV